MSEQNRRSVKNTGMNRYSYEPIRLLNEYEIRRFHASSWMFEKIILIDHASRVEDTERLISYISSSNSSIALFAFGKFVLSLPTAPFLFRYVCNGTNSSIISVALHLSNKLPTGVPFIFYLKNEILNDYFHLLPAERKFTVQYPPPSKSPLSELNEHPVDERPIECAEKVLQDSDGNDRGSWVQCSRRRSNPRHVFSRGRVSGSNWVRKG